MTGPTDGTPSFLASPRRRELAYLVGLAVAGAILPLVVYPIFAMKILYFALFACAYNLLFGYLGLLAFGHAASSSGWPPMSAPTSSRRRA